MEKLRKLIKIFIPRNKKSLISRVALKKARDYFVNEEKEKARMLIIKTLKENKWDLRMLWIELIAMIEDKTDYELIRHSWIKAPLSIYFFGSSGAILKSPSKSIPLGNLT